jgi:hypothetical protein
MAKKKAGAVNKSQSIRDYHKAHPKQKPKQIAADLGKKGIKVSPQFVSTILSTSKKKKTIGKPGRPKGSKSTGRGRPVGRSRKAARRLGEVSFDSLIKVKEIVREMGGIEDARAALTALEKLMN